MTTIRIDDPADERLADYRLLNDQRARRQHEGDDFFIAEGLVSIDRVIDSGHAVRSVLLTPSRVDRFAERAELLASHTPIYVVERDVLSGVVGFDLHRGAVAAAARRPPPSLEELVARGLRRFAVLEGLNDPENVGVIARAARALGIEALVLDPSCTDPYARRTVRVSMGEILHLPTCRPVDWADAFEQLHTAGVETWAMTPGADADDLWSLDVPDRVAIVLGAEGPGLPATTLARASRRVRIPIDPRVDSLNVGHAAAIAFAVIGRP